MKKTLKYKKRRKNSRRYKQKRRKTTRKSKRKHRRTKKQKGGLCCKYENDWNWGKGNINWSPQAGCGKGYSWGPGNPPSNAPPFLLPSWNNKVPEEHTKYYGNKFGMLKYTPVQIPENSLTPIDGINIGLFYHSLKHMEALGIKCYNVPEFIKVINEITQKGQWYYMRARDKLALQITNSPEEKTKKNFWTNKELTGVIYTKNPAFTEKLEKEREKNRVVFTNFKNFFDNITYSNNKTYNNPQNLRGLRTCNCMYVLNKPIHFTDENSNKWSQQKKDDLGRPVKQVREGYNIAAVNLIFAKFVTRRKEEKRMVLNEITETNKNTLFLLAIEVLNEDSLEKWCVHNSSTPDANSQFKKINLSLNNTSDCIGDSKKGWYLTRNNAAEFRNMGTVKALSLDNMKLMTDNENDAMKKQYTLWKNFVLNWNSKHKFLAEQDDKARSLIYPKNPAFLSAFNEIPHEALKKHKKRMRGLWEVNFVEKAKKFNFELRKSITDAITQINKLYRLNLPIGLVEHNQEGYFSKKYVIQGKVLRAQQAPVISPELLSKPLPVPLRFSSTGETKGAPPMLRTVSEEELRKAQRKETKDGRRTKETKDDHEESLAEAKIRLTQGRDRRLNSAADLLRTDPQQKEKVQKTLEQWSARLAKERGEKKETEQEALERKIAINTAINQLTDQKREFPKHLDKIAKLQQIVKALRSQFIDFYVEREVCQAPHADIVRERIDKQLFKAIFAERSYPGFVTIVDEHKIKFNSPLHWRPSHDDDPMLWTNEHYHPGYGVIHPGYGVIHPVPAETWARSPGPRWVETKLPGKDHWQRPPAVPSVAAPPPPLAAPPPPPPPPAAPPPPPPPPAAVAPSSSVYPDQFDNEFPHHLFKGGKRKTKRKRRKRKHKRTRKR